MLSYFILLHKYKNKYLSIVFIESSLTEFWCYFTKLLTEIEIDSSFKRKKRPRGKLKIIVRVSSQVILV